jgi:ribosome-associated toxin RatA of RatAB toxin-antitoxin module
MIRTDELTSSASVETCFEVGADVEKWPAILPHYRWVRFRDKQDFAKGVVEMAAWRPFGFLKYPTWWVSDMWRDPVRPVVYYRHFDGITRGMDVRWEFDETDTGTRIRIVHEWDGPRWPMIGRLAANAVIGPVFVSAIAQRTLAGVVAEAERRTG